jgi:hypothetical protein
LQVYVEELGEVIFKEGAKYRRRSCRETDYIIAEKLAALPALRDVDGIIFGKSACCIRCHRQPLSCCLTQRTVADESYFHEFHGEAIVFERCRCDVTPCDNKWLDQVQEEEEEEQQQEEEEQEEQQQEEEQELLAVLQELKVAPAARQVLAEEHIRSVEDLYRLRGIRTLINTLV